MIRTRNASLLSYNSALKHCRTTSRLSDECSFVFWRCCSHLVCASDFVEHGRDVINFFQRFLVEDFEQGIACTGFKQKQHPQWARCSTVALCLFSMLPVASSSKHGSKFFTPHTAMPRGAKHQPINSSSQVQYSIALRC